MFSLSALEQHEVKAVMCGMILWDLVSANEGFGHPAC
jgi:hypothetical protein